LIHTDFYGKARVGYDAELLEDVLKKQLGIHEIINTPMRISTPENVPVLDVQIASCLMELQFMVNTRRRTDVKISPIKRK